ncbi:hypothetical protein, partial [Coxiella burnetii]
ANLKTPLLDHSVNPFEPLMQRLLPETAAQLTHE